MRKYLVIGGAGYIGSHFIKEALAAGHDCHVLDDLSRGFRESLPPTVGFTKGSLLDRETVERVLTGYRPDAIFHFAAFALVGESVARPEIYYENNVTGVATLLDAMLATDVKAPVVFSSSCAVFGTPTKLPIAEDDPKLPISPYGRSKLMAEYVIEDYARAHGFQAMALRYFNACGADSSGEIGEAHDPETHLIPNVVRAALSGGKVTIFGDDFPTADGTCVRDYIHVSDLAEAHLKAADVLLEKNGGGFEVVHLGTGHGYSNLEVVRAIGQELGRDVAYEIGGRRPGDPPALYADNGRMKKVLGFEPRRSDLATIIRSALRWHQFHPSGYKK